MIRLFDDSFFNHFENFFSDRYGFSPQAKITKNDNEYEVSIAVPGLTSDDLKIIVKDGELKISYNKEDKKENSYFMESFIKTYSLPDYINDDKIKGKVDNGILKISLPVKKKKISEKLIEIE